MQIQVTIDEAVEVSTGVWSADLSPANVRQLGKPSADAGGRSILVINEPDYDSGAKRLAFSINAAHVLNVGTSNRALFVSAAEPEDTSADSAKSQESSDAKPRLGAGDGLLLKSIEAFPEPIRNAAINVLERVRQLDPGGDFRRHKNRFVNRRDNFVAIEPQTRLHQLLINVRGKVETPLPQLSTFNGYTAFKLSAPSDLAQVLRAIEAATRKPY